MFFFIEKSSITASLMDAAPYIIQVDALYFQARENGVSYAISDGKVCNPDFHSHFGARGKVGFNLCHDKWQLFAQFTHYHARARDAKLRNEILPTWGHPLRISNGFVEEVENLWRLHLGLGDLGVGLCRAISHCLQTTLFWGLRYAEVRHKLHIEYRGGSLFPFGEEEFSMKNKFWGIGPLVGLELFWTFHNWVGIFSRGVFSSPFGKIYVHQDEELSGERIKLFDKYTQTLPIFEGALGLDIRYCSCYFSVFGRLAFEAYIFFRQNQLIRFIDNSAPGKFIANQGNLTLHGLSFGLGIEF